MSPTVLDLGQKVKAKHPGQYDDLDDAEVGRRVKAKFPGAYDDFADATPDKTAGGLRTPGSAQGILDYTEDTLKNVPGSAAKLAGNMYQAVRHPLDTVSNLGKVAIGTLQNMTPGYVTPDRPGYSKEANAAGGALKQRYGSPSAIAETIRTDPVGAAADASVVAGGVSGLARGAGMAAKVANLPRAASTANTVADVARTVSDVANPLTVPLKAAGGAAKGIAKPLVKSALRLPGKTERYGATPATAALEETSGITPTAVRESATQRLAALNDELKALARASGDQADLTAARQVVAREIAEVERANGSAADLLPMQKQLNEAQPGFGGAVTPSGDVAAKQDPLQFLAMKRQFGDDFTKFDAAVPLKDSTRQVGNKAYHQLSTEFNRAVPGAQPVNQKIQSLAPVKEGAQRAEEGAGGVQRSIDRGTRPTGGLAATLFALHEKGIFGAAAVMAAQEMLASPTAKMAAARSLYGPGKMIQLPLTRRVGSSLGVAGETMVAPPPYRNPGDNQ